MEAGELAVYMFATCLVATLLQHPASPVRHARSWAWLSVRPYWKNFPKYSIPGRRKAAVEPTVPLTGVEPLNSMNGTSSPTIARREVATTQAMLRIKSGIGVSNEAVQVRYAVL
jgi:hypothetical protein